MSVFNPMKGPYKACCEERITNPKLQHVKWVIRDGLGELCELGLTQLQAEAKAEKLNLLEKQRNEN